MDEDERNEGPLEDSVDEAERKFRAVCLRIIDRQNNARQRTPRKNLFHKGTFVKPALRLSMIDSARAMKKRALTTSTPKEKNKINTFIRDSLGSFSPINLGTTSAACQVDPQTSDHISISSSSEQGGNSNNMHRKKSLQLMEVVQKISALTKNKTIQTSKNSPIKSLNESRKLARSLSKFKEVPTQTGVSLELRQNFRLAADMLNQTGMSINSFLQGVSPPKEPQKNKSSRSFSTAIDRPWRAPSGLQEDPVFSVCYATPIDDSLDDSDGSFLPKLPPKKKVFMNTKKHVQTKKYGSKANRVINKSHQTTHTNEESLRGAAHRVEDISLDEDNEERIITESKRRENDVNMKKLDDSTCITKVKEKSKSSFRKNKEEKEMNKENIQIDGKNRTSRSTERPSKKQEAETQQRSDNRVPINTGSRRKEPMNRILFSDDSSPEISSDNLRSSKFATSSKKNKQVQEMIDENMKDDENFIENDGRLRKSRSPNKQRNAKNPLKKKGLDCVDNSGSKHKGSVDGISFADHPGQDISTHDFHPPDGTGRSDIETREVETVVSTDNIAEKLWNSFKKNIEDNENFSCSSKEIGKKRKSKNTKRLVKSTSTRKAAIDRTSNNVESKDKSNNKNMVDKLERTRSREKRKGTIPEGITVPDIPTAPPSTTTRSPVKTKNQRVKSIVVSRDCLEGNHLLESTSGANGSEVPRFAGEAWNTQSTNNNEVTDDFESSNVRRSRRERRPPPQRKGATYVVCSSQREYKNLSRNSTTTFSSSIALDQIFKKPVQLRTSKSKSSKSVSKFVELPTIVERENISVEKVKKKTTRSGEKEKVATGRVSKKTKRRTMAVLDIADGNTVKPFKWGIKKGSFSEVTGMPGVSTAVKDEHTGWLKIHPTKTKPKQVAVDYKIVFEVLDGTASVGLNDNFCIFGKSDCFIIPPGGQYEIVNVHKKKDLMLSFAKFPKAN